VCYLESATIRYVPEERLPCIFNKYRLSPINPHDEIVLYRELDDLCSSGQLLELESIINLVDR